MPQTFADDLALVRGTPVDTPDSFAADLLRVRSAPATRQSPADADRQPAIEPSSGVLSASPDTQDADQQTAQDADTRAEQAIALTLTPQDQAPRSTATIGPAYPGTGISVPHVQNPYTGQAPIEQAVKASIALIKAAVSASAASGEAGMTGPGVEPVERADSTVTTETVKAGNDLLNALFQAVGPLVTLGAVTNPLATAAGLVRFYVIQKAGEKAADIMGARPEVQQLVGALAGLLSGVKSVRDWVNEPVRRAAEQIATDAKAAADQIRAERASQPATPSEPVNVGRGTTEAAQGAKPALQVQNEVLPPSPEPPVASGDVVEPPGQGTPPAPSGAVLVSNDAVLSDYRKAAQAGDIAGVQTARAELQRRGTPEPAVEAGSFATDLAAVRATPETPAKRSYSSTQVPLPKADADALADLAASIPDDALAEDGRETDPHVTVKYGIHTDEVAPLRRVLADEPPVRVTFGPTSVFPDAGHGDVVKVDVDSPDLHRLNALIAASVETTDTHPDYQPHATVAYVKPGLGAQFAGRTDMQGRTAEIDRVVFSTPDGTTVTIPLTGARMGASADVQNPPNVVRRSHGPVSAGSAPVAAGGRPADAAPLTPAERRELSRLRAKKYQREFDAAVAAAPADTIDRLIAKAHTEGYVGDDGPLRAELGLRLAAIQEFDADEAASGHNGIHLLKAIARHGGLRTRGGLHKGELDWLKEHRRGGKPEPFGALQGIPGVFKQDDDRSALTFDYMREALQQDPEFQHIETIDDLIAAIRDAATYAPDRTIPADKIEKSLPLDWWRRLVAVPEEQDAAESDTVGDTSFDPDAYERELQAVRAEDLDPTTGEAQRRLPEAGSVRDQDRQTPTFEAPFALSAESAQRTAVEPSLFNTDTPKFSKRDEPAPVFFSALTRAAEDLPQSKGTPQQFAAMLKKAKGVKQEEWQWSGIEPWLLSQQKFVTKQEIVDYLRANELQVTEVLRGHELNEDERGAAIETLRTTGAVEMPRPAKFAQHVLPGGSSYRELLITLPQTATKDNAASHEDALNRAKIIAHVNGDSWDDLGPNGRQRYIDAALRRSSGDFQGGHFDEHNVLVHLRFDDRTDADGKRVLFIEEVQSDWHQRGRKQGYAKEQKPLPPLVAHADVTIDGSDPHQWIATVPDGRRVAIGKGTEDTETGARSYAKTYFNNRRAELEQTRREDSRDHAPDAPFKTTWQELALKRAVRYGAEHGYDALAWTTGEQQNERYDLSKQVDSVSWTEWPSAGKDMGVLAAYKGDANVIRNTIHRDALPDQIGKDVAERLLAQPKGEGGRRLLSGEGLKVGGSGMKGFYDHILLTYLNKFGKPFGATVGTTMIGPSARPGGVGWETGDQGPSVHALPITDTMRQSVLAGLPLFNRKFSPSHILRSAREAWGLLDSTYAQATTVKMGTRDVAVIDAGTRFSLDEIDRFTANPAVQHAATTILDVLDEIIAKVVETDAPKVERTGLVFDDHTYGVFLPKPGARGEHRKAMILLNPFEHMLGPTDRHVAPDLAAERTYLTAVHEALHWHIGLDGPGFEEALGALLNTLGQHFALRATTRIMEAYADPTDRTRYHAGLAHLLPVYQASRRRAATAPDALSTAGRRAERPADRPDRARPPPGDVRPGGSKVVTRDDLKRLAKKRGTSVQHERERALDHGYEITDEGILDPTVRALADAAKNERNLILGVLAPAKVGLAPLAAGNIRAHTAANDQRKARVGKWLAPIILQMDRWSEDQSLQFADVMEGVQPLSVLDEEWRPIAQVFHDTLVTWRHTLLEHDLLESYLTHYWPHEWEQQSLEGKTLRKLFGRRPVQGPESYRKHRTIPTFRDGVQFGLTPATWNPAEMLQRKIFEMSQSLKGRALHDDLVKSGLYAYVPAQKQKPEDIKHWKQVPDYALGTKYGPKQEYGKLVLGHYYAPPEVVRLIENHLSPGLYGKSVLYDAYRAAGNLSTQLLLGWSSFHLWLTGLESVISKQSVAIEAAARGEWDLAAKYQAQVGPQGLIKDLLRGYRAVQTFYSRDADANEVAGIIGQIVSAGGGFGWSHFEHENHPAKFMRSLQGFIGAVQRGEPVTAGKKVAGMAAHGAMAAFELPTSAIMNHWVPYLKAAAFLDMAELEMRRLGPGARIEDVRKVMGDAWDTVDDRLGQLRYDNLFWDNTFKQVLTGGFLSVGWNLGSLRAGLGALGQIPRTAKQLQAAMGGGKPPMPPEVGRRRVGEGPEGQGRFEAVSEPALQRNVAWLFSLVAIVGIADALYQYLKSGKRPGEKDDGTFDTELAVRDLFTPRTGERDRNDREQRDAPISYLKDYYSWTHHPVTTAAHKLKPFLSMLYEAVTNENFYGDALRDENDPVLVQLWDTVKATLLRQLPISTGNALHRAGEGASLMDQWKAWLTIQAVPFTPAAAEIERSDLENYLQGLLPPLHRTKDQAAAAAARRQLRADLEAGKPDAIQQAKEKGLTVASIKAITRSERIGSLLASFQRTTWPQALKGFALATDEEREKLTPMMRAKGGRALVAASTPEAKDRIRQQRADLHLPPLAPAP